MSKTVLFQIIQLALVQFQFQKQFYLEKFISSSLNVKTVQFSINTQFKCKNSKLSKLLLSSIWPIDRTLSGATTPGQSRPGSNSNERVLRIPQSSGKTGTSPWDCLVSYPGYLLVGSYPLQRCNRCILQFLSTGQKIYFDRWKY